VRWNDLKCGYADRIAQMAKLSPHDLLGVGTQASREEIKAAYLRLVKAYHPDRSDPFMARHNHEVIKLINAAYEKLRADR
jgi:DnaJ-class molecular chaperone